MMEIIRSDVAIIGAGGAGLRAALALAEADPAITISLISKVYPMRSHTCAAEGGAAGVINPGVFWLLTACSGFYRAGCQRLCSWL